MSTDIYGRTAGRYLDRLEDGAPARGLLWAVLFGCLFVFGMELHDVVDAGRQPAVVTVEPTVIRHEAVPGSGEPRPAPRDRDGGLRQPIVFTLEPDGVLSATGTIDQGAAGRLASELKLRGDDVRTVSLNSPGGSLDDAILMARLIRKHGLATEVEDGALCASSCPLLLAGGADRSAGAKAVIGVHQFYASTDLSEDPADVMADAQLTTARIVRHLQEMGVDPALWFNALATPPQSLYYLSRQEMTDYRLLTTLSPVAKGRNASSS